MQTAAGTFREQEPFFTFSIDLLAVLNYAGEFQRINPAFEKTLGFSEDELRHAPFIERVHPEDKNIAFQSIANLERGLSSVHFQVRFRHKDGAYKRLEWTWHHVPADRCIYAIARDLTRMEEIGKAFERTALSDPMTGLFNRRGFLVHSERMMKFARRKNLGVTLMIADIDNLKWINDRFGHLEGDGAIRIAAQVLKARFRDSDVVARIGGDEFAALLLTDSPLLMGEIRRGLEVQLAERSRASVFYPLTVSTGFAQLAAGAQSGLPELMEAADHDMYVSKSRRVPQRPVRA